MGDPEGFTRKIDACFFGVPECGEIVIKSILSHSFGTLHHNGVAGLLKPLGERERTVTAMLVATDATAPHHVVARTVKGAVFG